MNERPNLNSNPGSPPGGGPVISTVDAATSSIAATARLRDLVRDEVVLSAATWVVKVGTSVLTGSNGTLDSARIHHLAEQISVVMDTGRKIALASSGAVGAGMGQLGLNRRPDNLRQLQAAELVVDTVGYARL